MAINRILKIIMNYWNSDQNQAILYYQNSNNIQRNEIYTKFLYLPINMIIDYQLYKYNILEKNKRLELTQICHLLIINKILNKRKIKPEMVKGSLQYLTFVIKNAIYTELHKKHQNRFDENYNNNDYNENDIDNNYDIENLQQSYNDYEILTDLEQYKLDMIKELKKYNKHLKYNIRQKYIEFIRGYDLKSIEQFLIDFQYYRQSNDLMMRGINSNFDFDFLEKHAQCHAGSLRDNNLLTCFENDYEELINRVNQYENEEIEVKEKPQISETIINTEFLEKLSLKKPVKVKAEKPVKVKTEKPVKVKTEKPVKVKTETQQYLLMLKKS